MLDLSVRMFNFNVIVFLNDAHMYYGVSVLFNKINIIFVSFCYDINSPLAFTNSSSCFSLHGHCRSYFILFPVESLVSCIGS